VKRRATSYELRASCFEPELLEDCDFEDCDFEDSDLEDSDLEDSDLEDSDLAGSGSLESPLEPVSDPFLGRESLA
jgi:uncharacterized protein YjbI with pentapeptide repeats